MNHVGGSPLRTVFDPFFFCTAFLFIVYLQQITAPAPLEDVVEAETGDRSAETRHVWARATC